MLGDLGFAVAKDVPEDKNLSMLFGECLEHTTKSVAFRDLDT